MQTKHIIHNTDARSMSLISDESVDLVVTSPPYPMIAMWDDIFISMNPSIEKALNGGEPNRAFELMNIEMDKVWKELYRVVKPGGVVCINIGDATRTIDGKFCLYSNHSRMVNAFTAMGFDNLPNIIWRKQTNAPNKFMGSGMLSPGAYVTLEHEFILIFRKGNKREFKTKESKSQRRKSAYFWEERNQWFSDLWEIKGTRQNLLDEASRKRSAAYPLEIPWRLINMFSQQGDVVLDPFLGTGTSSLAAIASGRNSIGVEMDDALASNIFNKLDKKTIDSLNILNEKRVEAHKEFVSERQSVKGSESVKHFNNHFNFPVMTRQETELCLTKVSDFTLVDKKEMNMKIAFL